METTQNILETEIGVKEGVTLKPIKVKVEAVETSSVTFGDKKKDKLVVHCKHPDREELIEISKVKYEKQGKLEITGLWITLDSDKKLQKGSALASLMKFVGVNKPTELVGKEISTIEDDQGYLVFKGY